MKHITVQCDQGSEEWHRARAGVITASMFSTIRAKVNGLDERQSKFVDAIKAGHSEASAMEVAGYKAPPRASAVQKALNGEPVGELSTAALDYAFRLAVERISGEPLDEGFQTWAMRRGNEMEHQARMEHETQSGLIVQPAGFVMTNNGIFGASADGLIGEDEGSEYKCFIAPEKLRAFWIDNDASSVMEQAQGCMWITGRKRWHICVYCPALESAGKQLWWKIFERDDEYIAQLEIDLMQFKFVVDKYEQELRKEAA